MTAKEYEERADWALQYTRSKVRYSATRNPNGFTGATARVVIGGIVRPLERGYLEAKGFEGHRPLQHTPAAYQWIKRMAALAESTGFGNCGEMAAVAFIWLFERQYVRPIDYMECDVDVEDHAYVVLGRPWNSYPRDASSWGDKAVICDPWKGWNVHVASYLAYRFKKLTIPRSSCYYRISE